MKESWFLEYIACIIFLIVVLGFLYGLGCFVFWKVLIPDLLVMRYLIVVIPIGAFFIMKMNNK